VSHPKPLVEFIGTGRFLPDRVVTNDDMSRIVDTSD
jgi:3-oxoacyl-[acyl-carrier-protein] synthase III